MANSPSAEPGRIDGLFELAFRRHQAGQLREAEELYRSILEADPRQLDALHFCGMIALQDGRPQEAADLIARAIAGNDGIAAYHAGIAEAYNTLGRPDDALGHYRRAVAIEPGDWAALQQITTLLLGRGEPNEALEMISRALTWKDSERGRTLFVEAARKATSYPLNAVFRTLLIRALIESWTRPADLAPAAFAMIKAHPVVTEGVNRALAAGPRRLSPEECGQAIGVLAGDDLLCALMGKTPVTDTALERLLASARTILLDAAVQATTDVAPQMITFACSLARQCAIIEYAFAASDPERKAVAALRISVRTALGGRAPVFEIHLIALAAYGPLSTLERDEALRGRKWSQPVGALIAEQIGPARSRH